MARLTLWNRSSALYVCGGLLFLLQVHYHNDPLKILAHSSFMVVLNVARASTI